MRMSMAFSIVLFGAASLAAQPVKVTILATTDLHGNIFPYDYFTAREAPRGLARIATLIAEARKSAPDALLIDCGDTIQGSTLEGVYQKSDLSAPDPMMIGRRPLV